MDRFGVRRTMALSPNTAARRAACHRRVRYRDRQRRPRDGRLHRRGGDSGHDAKPALRAAEYAIDPAAQDIAFDLRNAITIQLQDATYSKRTTVTGSMKSGFTLTRPEEERRLWGIRTRSRGQG